MVSMTTLGDDDDNDGTDMQYVVIDNDEVKL